MKLPEFCIRQPVFAVVLSLVLVVLGIVSFKALELRFFPKLELPIVTIDTYYQGASADLMESQVTTPIENAVAGIDNVASVSSNSTTENSYVTVLFRYGGNFEQEASSVRDKVFAVRKYLPTDSDLPIVTVGTNGQKVLGISVIDKQKSASDLRNYVKTIITPQLNQVAGVGGIGVDGGGNYAMRIWLHAAKMAAYSITVTDVKNALTSNNIYFPAGSFQGPQRNYGIVSRTKLTTPQQFANIILKHNSAGTVRLSDIASVALGASSLYESPMRINGQNGIELYVDPMQDANPITVAEQVKQKLAKIKNNLPPGMQVKVNYDASLFLQGSIDETFVAIAEAVLLVILVVFLFLGSLRAASIPIVTIPVSLIAVFSILKLLGFSINTMSLLGMVLAIGLVVDDAIVMLENVHRYIEEGMAPFKAAITGSKEIAGAVVAMGITLAAVYAPIGFSSGFTAELFREFAFTLAGAVVISAFVALTLSPMMCSRILRPVVEENRYIVFIDRLFASLSLFYQKALTWCLRSRHYVVLGLIVFAAVGYIIFRSLPSELIPTEDVGLVEVSVIAPSGSSLDYTERYVQQVENIVKANKAVASVMSHINLTSADINITLKTWGVRQQSTQQVVNALNQKFATVTGVDAAAFAPDVVNYGIQGSDIQLNLMTAGSYTDLVQPIHQLMHTLKQYPGVTDVQTNLKFDSQQYAITINRDLAGMMGVNIQDIADTIQAMMSGLHWTDVQSGSQSYPVLLQMQRKELGDFNILNNLYVHTKASATTNTVVDSNVNQTSANAQAVVNNNMVPVASLVTLTPIVTQGTLTHYDRFRSGTISARLAPGYTESQAIAFIKQHLPLVLKPNVQYAFSGKSLQFIQSAGSMFGLVMMALVFIYLVLSAQFGSFLDPLIILLAVPLCIVGALIFLVLTGGTMSIYSEIGFVTLIGLISKHGILITQFVNRYRQQGSRLHEAIIQGASLRLRPILMTTAAMVFGTLPLAIATGPGSIGRHQIGWVIIGGMLFGTFFSLFVVPVAYSYLGRFKQFKNNQIKN